jgi:dihydroorotase
MTDISRRDLLMTGVAAVAGVRLLAGQAAGYDLVIKGGRVIDPAARLDAVRDVAIARGKIALVANQVAPGAATVVDARGKLVVPGLIDIHTHAARSTDGAPLLLKDGVTGWIDAGSQGADHITDVIAVARAAPQTARVLINIGRAGIITEGDTKNLALADVAAAREAIAAHRDFVVGIKARLSSDVAGDHDYDVLKRAQEAAGPSGIPVMIHMGQTASPLPKLLPILKRGDIVTHMFAPAPHGILDDRGRLLPEVIDARRRGVWFDVGNGRLGHVRWDVVDAVMKQRFWPDAISTDWNTMSRTTGVVDICNCMSKFLGYGMSVADVVACNTANAAKMFPVFKGRGTLAVGAPADIAILELRDGPFEFLDNYDNKMTGRQRLFAVGTVLNGAVQQS